ncbi:phytochromobilin:ferredoxin oxidoreductase, chloroplastic isoform X2 [Spinacia oleracea]|uniref:Phytochromobilin:ferredoxin oxidoreductase, chloroplastic isoform X2 n=1 Tax=Spinacia oleracea TaxID=3562 RepID=A0A9R0K400_SPIOL|nr:phytochromobilin:ferredoxin oxidoreductase, chloroplastic isoform X2 [Spinacia oleracea]
MVLLRFPLPEKLNPCSRCQYNNRTNKFIENKIKLGTQIVSALSYQKFVDFAVDETKHRTHLIPSPLQEKFSHIQAVDGKAKIDFLSFEASKIRLLRSMHIDGGDSLQVLDFGIFPNVAFDMPIFCANFFTSSSMSIIVLDLNPLHDVISNREYKEKYYKSLMPLSIKYAELLPWGGKLTGESLRFFSPIVIWTRFTSSQHKGDILFDAFNDYYKTWLDLMEHAVQEQSPAQVMLNSEAQHKYLTWRAEKDPGHSLLKKLVGEAKARDVLRSFLFNGVDELSRKTFLDYFPEYKLEDGSINDKRSMMGKSFENRPWDSKGELVDNC